MTLTLSSLGSKTRYVVTLLSGTSWTVPTGCLYVNATLFGGGAGSGGGSNPAMAGPGSPGQRVVSNFVTTPGAPVTYAIAAGGTGGATNLNGTAGGTTTMTGATSAAGGAFGGVSGTVGAVGIAGEGANNQGQMSSQVGGTGGQGKIELEYWA